MKKRQTRLQIRWKEIDERRRNWWYEKERKKQGEDLEWVSDPEKVGTTVVKQHDITAERKKLKPLEVKDEPEQDEEEEIEEEDDD
jgi:hypothetical protein